jgi:hypothetical protein
MAPIITADTLLTNAQGDGNQTGQHAVAEHARIRFAQPLPDVEHRRDCAASPGQHGVGCDDGDPQVAAGERRTRIEPEPAKRQDERAGQSHRNVVSRHRHRFTALVVFADARTDHDRAGERSDATDHVDNRGTGEVDVSMAKTEVGAKLRQPSGAPHPVGENRIHEHRHEEPEDDECGELPAFSHRAGRDGPSRVHEHHLEQEQRKHSDVVGVATQKETLQAEETK